MSKTLLPPGCYDVLPPAARLESELTYRLLGVFEAHGYEQVAPPMLEYTDSLLAGRGAALSQQILRVMDPASQRVMGFRTDMTLQIGRIATHRLGHAPRPLRLSYAGTILRNHPDALNMERQLRQAGIELIGANSPQADAEVIVMAMAALKAIGIPKITIDLNMPPLIGAILADAPLDNEELQDVFHALAHKDSTTLASFDVPACALLTQLMHTSGTAEDALAGLKALQLPEAARAMMDEMETVIALISPHSGADVTLTIDVTERGGFDYYSGISFACFATGAASELGRGGRYLAGMGATQESAVGCSFYADTLRDLLPAQQPRPRAYIAEGVNAGALDELHRQGYITIRALPDEADAQTAAKRLGCDYIYQKGTLEKL